MTTAVAFGLAAPASAAPAVPAAVSAVSSGQAAAHLSGRDPFPKKSPAAIQALSLKAAKAAKSVRLVATVNDGTQVIKIDAVMTKTASKGRMVMSAVGTVDLIQYGKVLYLRGDAKFWATATKDDAEAAKAAPLLVGKWIQYGGNDAETKQMKDLITLGSWTKILGEFHPAKRVAGKKVAGKATVGLIDTTGKDGGIEYVAAAGAPYPLLMTANDKSLTLSFSDWNKSVKIAKPKGAIVVK